MKKIINNIRENWFIVVTVVMIIVLSLPVNTYNKPSIKEQVLPSQVDKEMSSRSVPTATTRELLNTIILLDCLSRNDMAYDIILKSSKEIISLSNLNILLHERKNAFIGIDYSVDGKNNCG